MPGFFTHFVFGEQTLSFIESKETRRILDAHPTCYALGLQGPDIFFYHAPASICYKKNIGNVMHRRKVMLFFDFLFDARNTFEESHDRRICDAYIMGFMGHYSLDAACHPYIYFKSDHFNNMRHINATKYDNGKHISLETDIDHVLLEHYKKIVPSKFDYPGTVKPSDHEQDVIANLLHIAINKTYEENKVRLGTVRGAIKSFINLNRKMNDPTGKKKRTLRKIEQILYKCAWLSSIIPSDTIVKYKDPCNLFHNAWYNPWYPEVERTDSVIDIINKTMPIYINRIELYMKSCGNSSLLETSLDKVVNETNTYLHYRNILLVDLSDNSYLSGLPIED